MTHKYHAVATQVDGITFASKAEARRRTRVDPGGGSRWTATSRLATR